MNPKNGNPPVSIFTEQRCWSAVDGRTLGRQRLSALHELSQHVGCRVIARLAPAETDGMLILSSQSGASTIQWPAKPSDLHTVIVSIMSVLKIVLKSRVVLIYCPGALGTLAGMFALLLRKPLVVIAVGSPAAALSPEVAPGHMGTAVRIVAHAAMRLLCRQSDVCRYVTRHAIQSDYPPGPKTNSFEMTDAVDLPEGNSRDFPTHRPIHALTVATLERPYKGIADLISVIQICRNNGLDIQLDIVGEGCLRHELEQSALKLVGDHVIFHGPLYGTALIDAYMNADCFLLASWTEGMPRVLVEAMASGLPCVATSVGGVPELVEDEQLAEARNPQDFAIKLEHLLSLPTNWRRISSHNIRKARLIAQDSLNMEGDFITAIESLAGARCG